MNVLVLFLILIIVYLIIKLCHRNSTIDSLKEDIKFYEEIEEEHDYYYKLAESLWEHYREYDIFPSKFVRKIDEMGRW